MISSIASSFFIVNRTAVSLGLITDGIYRPEPYQNQQNPL